MQEAQAVFLALLALAYGLASLCRPRWLWDRQVKWLVKGGGEPSRAAIIHYRAMGVFGITLGLVMLVGMAVYSF
jgi:hypothetical protein